MIKVVVQGASGRIGQEAVKAVCQEPDMELVGVVDLQESGEFFTLPDGSGKIPFSSSLDDILAGCRPDVLVDFSVAKAVMPAVRLAVGRGVNLVIGTTGLGADELGEIGRLATAKGVGAVVAPNFALGAILMTHLAKIAAKYFDYAEIIELHHHRKVDAPSGTALSTARAMTEARGKPFLQIPGDDKKSDSRGMNVGGVPVHSVRLPGLMAHQEVLFGASGQTLRIRHDTINRECYMPGVMLAIKKVVKQKGLVYGLDTLLDL